jgi:hypothetical protein
MIELGRGSATSAADPDAFFARWIEHDTWQQWSPDTEWVRIDGPAAVGTRGVLKPRGGPKVKFVITACDPGREYTDTSRLPGARLTFQHTVVADGTVADGTVADGTVAGGTGAGGTVAGGTGSKLAVLVTMSGPLSRVWAKIMGGGFRESAQGDLNRLVALVEGR